MGAAEVVTAAEFDPPSGYSFEPEFLGHPPRQIAESLMNGPYARKRRAAIIGLATFGAACLVFSYVPGIDTVAYYILPLAYLDWIGLGGLAAAGVSALEHSLRRGPYRYVRDGLPLVARVVDLVKAPSSIVNGAPATHAFTAAILFKHPTSGELTAAQVKSNDFSSSSKDSFDTPFKVGDYVTAVYLPRSPEKSLRLYAFLDLSPDVNLRRAAPAENTPPWQVAFLVLTVCALFAVLFANVYAYGRYQPIDFGLEQALRPLLAGGLVLGGGLLAALYLNHRREQARVAERAAEALAEGKAVEVTTPFLGGGLYGWVMRLMLALGAPLMGGLTAVCWCFMLNAWLDRSAPRPVPATISGMTMTTHALLFREYTLEYRLQGSAEKHKLLTTPHHLAQLEGSEATAQLREGWLGWPWVETVTPGGR